MPDRRGRVATYGLLALLATGCTAGPDASSTRSSRPSASPTASSAAPGYELSGRCGPPPRAMAAPSVERLNAAVADADLEYWQAGDIGASAPLSDGRIAWIFGDTIRARGVSPGMVANSILITSGLCPSQVLPKDRGPVIPDAEPDAARPVVRWPMSVVVVAREDDDLLVVFTGRIRRGPESDIWDFRYIGADAALFTVRAGEAPQPAGILPLSPDEDDPQQITWGSASMVAGGHIYVYGTRLPSRTSFGRSLHVGRAALDDPSDEATWEFWDGEGWQADRARASAIIPSEGGVSQTLSVDEIGDRVVAVSKQDGDLGSTVSTWSSDSPVGPWERSAQLEAPFLTGDDEYAYAPLAHPEVVLADGRLLISISRNTTDLQRLREHPVVGRPRFAAIERP